MRRLVTLLVCLGLVGLARAEEPAQKPLTLRGKVVPLKPLLQKAGSRLDRDAEPFWLTLVTKKGDIYPIVKDDGGRRFFNDERLLDREVEITGRLFQGTHLLQVLTVHGLKDGKLTEIYYWCDICQIKRHELNTCECCGGEMYFKEKPLDR